MCEPWRWGRGVSPGRTQVFAADEVRISGLIVELLKLGYGVGESGTGI